MTTPLPGAIRKTEYGFGAWTALAAAAMLACGVVAAPAQAATYSFDFNTLSDGASNAKVQTYMNGVLGNAGSVVVTGSVAERNYTGDDHVVGSVSGRTVTSLTLGNTDGGVYHSGALDTFLTNIPNKSSEIAMAFSGLLIYSVSFDYEIFPDAGCANGNTCGSSNYPDFTFKADGATVFQTIATLPSSPNNHSPSSGSTAAEKAPQYLSGTVTYTFASGVSYLQFMDWPTLIGIDNLVISTTAPSGAPTPVPEPATLLLLGSGLLGVGALRRRAARRG